LGGARVTLDNFADRLVAAQRSKGSALVVGIDPQLDAPGKPGVPAGYSLQSWCCAIVEACAELAVAIKPQLAFFEARGLEGMRAFAAVVALARRLDLIVIADAKRADIGSTAAAYAQAFLGEGEFGCDAMTVNPYLGSDGILPFLAHVQRGRGLFVLVKTSNPSSGEFQDLLTPQRPLWESIAVQVDRWGRGLEGGHGLSAVGAVMGATYPRQAARARALMPTAIVLSPGLGAQGASAQDAVAAARADGLGVVVNASRAVMYAYQAEGSHNAVAAARAAASRLREHLAQALAGGGALEA